MPPQSVIADGEASMWLSITEGADYLVQKYGPGVARRLDHVPPADVGADGRRGYNTSDLDAFALKAMRNPNRRGEPVRGRPISEQTSTLPVAESKDLHELAREWTKREALLSRSERSGR